MININELREVTTVNSRVDYDLRWSPKTKKFNMSQDFYNNHDVNNHGFRLYISNGHPVLEVVSNDRATIHKGREDAENKGLQFTARSLETALNLDKEEVTWNLNSQEVEGRTFLIFDRITDDESITAETAQEETEEVTPYEIR